MRSKFSTSVVVALAFVMGHVTGTSGDLHAAEPLFGEPVAGLAVAVQLDRSTIRPGKRLLAHVLLKNVTDKPIRMMRVPTLSGWEITTNGKSRRLPAAEQASPWQPDPATAFIVPPQQIALLMSRQLEGAFDLATDGEYLVRYKLSFTREPLGKGTAADELWSGVVKTGVWTGACDAPSVRLSVSAKGPIAGGLRTASVKVVGADKSGLWIDELEGDSSLYPGQVVETNKRARLRIDHLADSGKWLLTPVPPLQAESVRVGDELNVEEEDYHWMLSDKSPAQGQPMGGLSLVLEMDKDKLSAGEPWTGKLRVVNQGKQPVHVSRMGQLLTNLRTTTGNPPKIEACIGRGLGPDRKEIDESRKVINPGGSLVLLQLEKPDPEGNLGGEIGNNFVAWKVAPGRYELSFKYWMSLESSADYDLKPVFTGVLHSNSVEIVVSK